MYALIATDSGDVHAGLLSRAAHFIGVESDIGCGLVSNNLLECRSRIVAASTSSFLHIAYAFGLAREYRPMYAMLFPLMKASPYFALSCPSTYSSVCSSATFM
jgi:hypothetical protein